MKPAPDPQDRDTVAGLYRAIALRFYFRYADMRSTAARHGGDLANHGPVPNRNDVGERYRETVEEFIGDTPRSPASALALVELAGVLAADRVIGRITHMSLDDEQDVFDQMTALAGAADWLNRTLLREMLDGAPGRRRPQPAADQENRS